MARWNESQIRAAASTASIHKTLNDIDAILDGIELVRESPKREELRCRIRQALSDVAARWLQDGFKGGHAVAIQSVLDNQRLPISLSRSITRHLPGKPEAEQVQVRSSLSKELSERAEGWNSAT
jgi:hypothetical protein